MIKRIAIFILLPIILTVSGEFVLKATINDIFSTKTTITTNNTQDIKYCQEKIKPTLNQKIDCILSDLKIFVLNTKIVLSLLAIILGGILWLVALSKFELSFLYPFLSINYLSIIFVSQILLKETVDLYRYLSVVLIILGLVFISRSPYSESEND